MLKNNDVTASILFGSIVFDEDVEELLAKAFERHYVLWALASLDELVRRNKSDLIVRSLDTAFDKGQLHEGSPFMELIAKSLVDCKDRYLRSYGKSLLNGEFLSPSAWAEKRSKELDTIGHDPAGAREIRCWIHFCKGVHAKAPADTHPRCGSDLLHDLQMEQRELH